MIKSNKLTKRQIAIQELIKTHAIEDQAKLINLLKNQYGIITNQAAISRDLRKLGIHKRVRGQTIVYELPEIDTISEILHYAVKSVAHNEYMIIVNTVPGTAAVVGDFLDAQQDLPMLGNLAGENVVFVIPLSIKNIEELSNKLSHRLKVKDEKL